ncbi:MAG TPA: hypothetical protein VFL66_00715 [Gaiellaceae bacterium]|nr:hypothetical protein [Gaiellaceae bacterium]
MRKFVYANGILNVGPEISDLLDDEYDHGHLLRQLGEYEFGAPGQGYGVVEGETARIDVDADGLEEALREVGFEVRRIKLIRWDDGDEEFDSAGEDE